MTMNVTNLPAIEGEFVLKNLTIVKEGNIFSSVKFENVITQEEQNIIKNFNFSTFYDCGKSFPRASQNFNSTTINNNEKNNPNEKVDKLNNNNNNNNSIIYNNEINAINIYNSNNENIFNKNNSFTPNFNNYANANSNTTNNLNNNPNQLQQSIKNANTNINLNNYVIASFNNNLIVNPIYSFFKIVIKNLKIVILKKLDVLVVGFFSNHTSTCLIKGYLLHIYVSYNNYSNDIFETAKSKFKEGTFFTGYNKQNMYFRDNSASTSPIRDRKDYNSNANHFVMNTQGADKNLAIKNVGGANSNNPQNSNSTTNLIELSNFIQMMNKKFFELYLVNPITSHYEKLIKYITIKDDAQLPNRKLKNVYSVDINSEEIIFDLMEIRGIKKYKKIQKNKLLWHELLFHFRNLQNQYKAEHKLKSDLADFQYNFVKVECTSTYPRLIFVLKFLPVLGGVGLIQIYSQNKLSRNTESDRYYKEFQVSYGSDIKLNTNVDFIYHEPKKLKEIEKFFLEYFILTKQNDDLFYDVNHDLKYFDYSLLAIIDEVLNNEKISFSNSNANNNNNNNNSGNNPNANNNLNSNGFLIENILFKINNLYYELYVNGTDYEKVRIPDDNNSNDIYSNNRNTNMNDTSNYNVNRQMLNTGNANNNILINNNSDSVTIQTYNPNFLVINKDMFLKEILKITNNFVYLNVNRIGYYNQNAGSNLNNPKYDTTLILSRNEIYNPNYIQNNYEGSLDLTNKFSDLSALEEERNNTYYNNNTYSNLGLNNNQNNQRQNILNNISASFDVILSSLYPRNINTEVGYESQMVTTNMFLANINTINFNNSISEGHSPHAHNNFSISNNMPVTHSNNNLNTTLSVSENNVNSNLNKNNMNFNTMGNIPLSLNAHLNTNSNLNNNNNIFIGNNNNNNFTANKNSGGRVNTLGSFGKNSQQTVDKPQISIQNFASPLRNKLIGNKINPGIPMQPMAVAAAGNKNVNNKKNTRGSQGHNDLGKVIKVNLMLNQPNDLNGNYNNSPANSLRNINMNSKANSEKIHNIINANNNTLGGNIILFPNNNYNPNSPIIINNMNQRNINYSVNNNYANCNDSESKAVKLNSEKMIQNQISNQGKANIIHINNRIPDNKSVSKFSKSQNSMVSDVIFDDQNIPNIKDYFLVHDEGNEFNKNNYNDNGNAKERILDKVDLASNNSLILKAKIDSENLKAHSKNLKSNQKQGINTEIKSNQIRNNANLNEAENTNFKNDHLNVDDNNNLKDKINPIKKQTTVKFKDAEANEAEPILSSNRNKEEESFSNAEKIKDILNRAKIMQTNSEMNNDLKNSPIKSNLKNTPPRTPEKNQVYNMIELGSQAEAMFNNKNVYESPNMIKDSLKIHSNGKNQPNAIEFIQEKNISNTTFRAGSEVNKNK